MENFQIKSWEHFIFNLFNFQLYKANKSEHRLSYNNMYVSLMMNSYNALKVISKPKSQLYTLPYIQGLCQCRKRLAMRQGALFMIK